MEVKGTAIANTRQWIIGKYGDKKWKEICDLLDNNLKIYISDYIIFPSQWYPFELFNEINKIIVKEIGNGDKKIIFQIAREGAIKNFNSIYKIFIKIAKSSYVAKKTALIYNQFYNFGKMEVASLERGHYTFSLNYVDNYPLLFERIAGYMDGVLFLTKVKDLEIKYKYQRDTQSVIFDVFFEEK